MSLILTGTLISVVPLQFLDLLFLERLRGKIEGDFSAKEESLLTRAFRREFRILRFEFLDEDELRSISMRLRMVVEGIGFRGSGLNPSMEGEGEEVELSLRRSLSVRGLRLVCCRAELLILKKKKTKLVQCERELENLNI